MMAIRYKWDITTGYSSKSGKYRSLLESAFIHKYLPKQKIKVLDIGGGSGRFAIPLSKYGNDVTVVEPNNEAISILSKKSTIKCINCTFEEFASSEKFDLVLIIEVLGNFMDIESVFSKVYNMLSSNGILIISTRNTNALMNKLKLTLRRKRYIYNGYTTINSYKKLLNEQKFDILEISGLNWLPFGVNSNSRMIPFFIFLIKILALNKWISQSPEVLICSLKRVK